MGIGTIPGTDASKSVMRVPMVSGDRVIGVINVENHERENAFGEAAARLLTTVAASLGVALENARLFDETQRLLKETEQRNAELAVITSIQQSVGAALGFQAIVDVVGDKLREVFKTGDISINWWEEETDRWTSLYTFEHGVRLHQEPIVPLPGDWWHGFLREKRVLVYNSVEQQIAENCPVLPGTDRARSIVAVPMLVGDRILGGVGLENHQCDNAFGPAEIRLLETITASMSVALENARLFAQAQTRAQELATVNTVSQQLAGKRDVDALIEVVGEQVRGVFRADLAYVALYDRASNLINFPYHYGEMVESRPYGEGLTSKIIGTGRALKLDFDVEQQTKQLGTRRMGKEALSYLGVPIMVGGRCDGVLSVQSTQREGAYDDADQRLLETIAANVGIALENARLFDENKEARAAAESANEAKSSFNDLRAALAANDAATFRRAAHTLKSNGNTFGALTFATQARALELAGLGNVKEGGTKPLDDLDAEFARVAAALAALRYA